MSKSSGNARGRSASKESKRQARDKRCAVLLSNPKYQELPPNLKLYHRWFTQLKIVQKMMPGIVSDEDVKSMAEHLTGKTVRQVQWLFEDADLDEVTPSQVLDFARKRAKKGGTK